MQILFVLLYLTELVGWPISNYAKISFQFYVIALWLMEIQTLMEIGDLKQLRNSRKGICGKLIMWSTLYPIGGDIVLWNLSLMACERLPLEET